MSGLYSSARAGFLSGSIDWDGHTIKAVLVDTDVYTVDLIAHDFLADIPIGARLSTSPALSGKTVVDGVADADDVTFPSVTGAAADAIVLYRDTGDAATSPLIVFIDEGSGLPYTPTGADVLTTWDNGPLRIFRL